MLFASLKQQRCERYPNRVGNFLHSTAAFLNSQLFIVQVGQCVVVVRGRCLAVVRRRRLAVVVVVRHQLAVWRRFPSFAGRIFI